MTNAIFTASESSAYDDLIEVRYHFPATYLRQIEATVSRTCDPKDLTDEELAAIIMAAREAGSIPEVIIRGGLPD